MDTKDLQERLTIPEDRLRAINDVLFDPNTQVVHDFLKVVAKYGTPEEINAKAEQARKLENLMGRLQKQGSPYLADLEWLIAARDRGDFITIADYRRGLLGDRAASMACLLYTSPSPRD